MRFAFLGLAACAAPPSPQPVSRTTTPVPVVTMPSERPPAPFELPAAVATALANEPLQGNVVVVGAEMLHATLAAARAAPVDKPYEARAMTVVREHGEVVEVSTARVQDCVASFEEPYQLAVYVKRASLMPRATAEVVRTFRDDSAVAIDRGAPIVVEAGGPRWWFAALASTPVRPRVDALAYVVAGSKPAALPASTGERLVCDRGNVQTVTEHRAARQVARDAEHRERERAEAAAGRKTAAKTDALSGLGKNDLFEDRYLPYCNVGKPWQENTTAAPPTVDGQASGLADRRGGGAHGRPVLCRCRSRLRSRSHGRR